MYKYTGLCLLMGFIGLFLAGSCKTKVDDADNSFLAKDNIGTRYDTIDEVSAAWQTQGMSYSKGKNVDVSFLMVEGTQINTKITPKEWPFVHFSFDGKEKAGNALSSLSFIKTAKDSGEYISLKVLEFGLYKSKGDNQYEVIIWGNDLDRESFKEAKEKLFANGGVLQGSRDPNGEKKQAPKKRRKTVEKKPKVTYQGTEKQGPHTYETYKAGSKEDALAFLKTKFVDKKLYYIVVETPDGNWGRDIQGIYQE